MSIIARSCIETEPNTKPENNNYNGKILRIHIFDGNNNNNERTHEQMSMK